MRVEYADLAAELYRDGWGLKHIADFFNATGFKPVKTRWYQGSFKRAFVKRCVEMRPVGRPRS